MEKNLTTLKEIKLVGITARTNNTQIFASELSTNIIAATIQEYVNKNLAKKINDRKNPGTTFCVYTNYESDINGDYTYFIGEEVTSFDKMNEGLVSLTIPMQKYAKFTNKPGPMPIVCINMWQNIWKMDTVDLGGERSYIADFEIYDERSSNPHQATLDIYIGLKN